MEDTISLNSKTSSNTGSTKKGVQRKNIAENEDKKKIKVLKSAFLEEKE